MSKSRNTSGPGLFLFGEEEKQEVLDLLEGGYLSRFGSEDNPRFKQKAYNLEQEYKAYSGAEYCIALNSGTSALLVSLASLGIGPGDEVLVPGYCFIASLSSIIFSRAVPVLCEIDESLTVDPEDLRRKITPRTKAIMPVHMLGNPSNMDAIMQIAREYGLYVLEDACQANGASYKGQKVGTIGDIGTFSLNVYKTVTCGEGGLIVTDDSTLYERAFAFHDQGHLPNRKGVEIGNRGLLGLNCRITELNAAVALAQLRKLDFIITTLHEKKNKLKALLAGTPGIKFRMLNDPEGECATLCTLIFDSRKQALNVSKALGTTTLDSSGWHVYSNMEQLLGTKMPSAFKCPFECPIYEGTAKYERGMLPNTDDILSRSINLSIGVVDSGISAGFGINILSSDEDIERAASLVREACVKVYTD